MESTMNSEIAMDIATHRDYRKGVAAGFIATVVLSALMLTKTSMGLMSQLDPIQMLGNMIGSHGALLKHEPHAIEAH
jgi:hypothetical protein